jgi:hypothetical protein
MTTLKKYQYLSCLILASCCAIANSQTIDPNTQKLQFEISKQLPEVHHWEGINDNIAYSTLLCLKNAQDLRFGENELQMGLLNTKTAKSMSEKQRNLLADLTYRDVAPYENKKRGGSHFRVFAVSEQDAEKTIEALIEYLNSKAQTELENAKKHFEEVNKETNQTIQELEKKIAELEKEYKSLNESQIDKVIEKRWHRKYVLVPVDDLFQELTGAIKEIKDRLRLLNYDSSNLQAKIEKIQQLKLAKKITDQNILTKLDDLLITYEIELAGLSKEREVVLNSLAEEEQVADVLNMITKRQQLPNTIQQVRDELAGNQNMISALETELSRQIAQYKPVKVIDNKVIIYQLPPKQPPADSPDSQPTSPQP